MKILAIIPARGGSKGISRKNIVDLGDKPLIEWTIEASLNSKYITRTIVSSEDSQILKIAINAGAEIVERPPELALDTTPTEPVVAHVLQECSEGSYDYLILLQPTSPFRDQYAIDLAIEELLRSNATALISTTKIDSKILKAFISNEKGYLEGVANNDFPFMRRQDLPNVFMPNGAIYIVSVDEFLKYKKLFTDKTVSFVMGRYKSMDIDDEKDLEYCRSLV